VTVSKDCFEEFETKTSRSGHGFKKGDLIKIEHSDLDDSRHEVYDDELLILEVAEIKVIRQVDDVLKGNGIILSKVPNKKNNFTIDELVRDSKAYEIVKEYCDKANLPDQNFSAKPWRKWEVLTINKVVVYPKGEEDGCSVYKQPNGGYSGKYYETGYPCPRYRKNARQCIEIATTPFLLQFDTMPGIGAEFHEAPIKLIRKGKVGNGYGPHGWKRNRGPLYEMLHGKHTWGDMTGTGIVK